MSDEQRAKIAEQIKALKKAQGEKVRPLKVKAEAANNEIKRLRECLKTAEQTKQNITAELAKINGSHEGSIRSLEKQLASSAPEIISELIRDLDFQSDELRLNPPGVKSQGTGKVRLNGEPDTEQLGNAPSIAARLKGLNELRKEVDSWHRTAMTEDEILAAYRARHDQLPIVTYQKLAG